jgi:hypothetical protein
MPCELIHTPMKSLGGLSCPSGAKSKIRTVVLRVGRTITLLAQKSGCEGPLTTPSGPRSG